MKSSLFLGAAGVIILGGAVAHAQSVAVCPTSSGACPFTATNVPMLVTFQSNRHYQRICNASASVSLWATRAPGVAPAVNGAGSFEIKAGACEEYPIAGTNYVPPAPTSVIAASGTAPGSVETN